jgi:hypothetical protein
MLAAAELALLTEPDGRASPGWESLRSSLTIFNLLSLVAAFSSVLGAGVGVFYSFHLARHFGNGGHCFSLTLKAVVLCYNLCVQTIAVGDDHGTVLPPPAPITIALDRAPIWCVTALLLSPPALGVLAALFAGADLKCALAAFFFSYTVHVFHKALARLTKYSRIFRPGSWILSGGCAPGRPASAALDGCQPHPVGQCDPLVPRLCALPFPSSFFLRPDPRTRTGYRVSLGGGALPFTRARRHVDPTVGSRPGPPAARRALSRHGAQRGSAVRASSPLVSALVRWLYRGSDRVPQCRAFTFVARVALSS